MLKTITSFASRLRHHRQRRGLSQVALAALVGCAQHHVSNLESGKRKPSLATAIRFAKALGVGVEMLAG